MGHAQLVLSQAASIVQLAIFLLLSQVIVPATAQSIKPPVKEYMAPMTAFKPFKSASTAVADDLNKQKLPDAYTTYLKSVRSPVTQFSSAKATTFSRSLRRVLLVNKVNKNLKFVLGITKFTELNDTERASFAGFVPPDSNKTIQQIQAETAAHLRATRKASVEDMDQIAAAALAATGVATEVAAMTALASAGTGAAAAAVSPDQAQPPNLKDLPDWTSLLPVVKDQGTCNSCWAFAAAALGEAMSFTKTGKVISLSEKHLLDCVADNGGCDGGFFNGAFKYMVNNGITYNSVYPYIAIEADSCPPNLPPKSKLSKYTALPKNNENALLNALKIGPIATAIKMDNNWFEYKGGIYTAPKCDDKVTPNHAVVIVAAGYDSDLKAPYWLVRNSFGLTWGEGGYVRVLRGVGGRGTACIASYPYQAVSADKPVARNTTKSSMRAAAPGCTDKIFTVTNATATSLWDVAVQYNTTIAGIVRDNNLTCDKPLVDGQKLVIKCPIGYWTEPYGYFDWEQCNTIHVDSAVHVCPPGEYAVRWYIKPSKWYYEGEWLGGTFVGQITMTCSGGSEFTVDAQPGYDPGWEAGTMVKTAGFAGISMRTSFAIESMFGVGVQAEEQFVSCPDNTVVTGFAAAADVVDYPETVIVNLQFLCQNPLASAAELQYMLRSGFPRVSLGLSCSVHIAEPTDSWLTVALRYGVPVLELVRSNPTVASVSTNTTLFIPPCNLGSMGCYQVLEGGNAVPCNEEDGGALSAQATRGITVRAKQRGQSRVRE